MIEYLELDRVFIAKMLLFFFSGFLAMLFAYYRKWSDLDVAVGFMSYISRDGHAVGRALTTLVAMLFGASGLDFLDALTLKQVFLAGVGIGLVVPDKILTKAA